MFKKHKDEIKNILNSVERIIKYARKRREMAYCAIRVLNNGIGYCENVYYRK